MMGFNLNSPTKPVEVQISDKMQIIIRVQKELYLIPYNTEKFENNNRYLIADDIENAEFINENSFLVTFNLYRTP